MDADAVTFLGSQVDRMNEIVGEISDHDEFDEAVGVAIMGLQAQMQVLAYVLQVRMRSLGDPPAM